MRLLPVAALAACALAPTASTQTGRAVLLPPRAGETPRRVAPEVNPTWEAEQRDGYLLEASTSTEPRFVIPETGIRPTDPGRSGQDQEEAPSAKLTGLPPFFSGPRFTAPVLDDRGVDTAFQPTHQGWEGIGPNGFTPPDPDLACGRDYVVTVTNDDFATYDKCGNELFRADIHDFLGISTLYKLFDPKVLFDPWDGRWVMLFHKERESTEESSLLLIVTAGSTPFGLPGSGTYFYDFDAVQFGGTADAAGVDYFDLGYSNDFLTTGGNMFEFVSGDFVWGRVWCWDKDQVYTASAAGSVRFSGLTNGDGSTTDTPRATKMQTGWSEGGFNIDGTYVNSRSGGGNALTHWKLTDAFAGNVLTKTDIAVGAYSLPPLAVQPTGETLDTIDCRLMPAVTTVDTFGSNGIELFTSLTTASGSDARVRLVKLDPVNDLLEFESTFGATGLDYWFASPAADYSGSNVWVFARTGAAAGNEPELRFVDYDQGTFSSSSAQLRDGDGSYDGFRWGDYFGGQMDWDDYDANFSEPGRPSKLWMYGEFGKNDSWGTYVGATSVWTEGELSAVTPTTTYVSSGGLGGPFVPSSRTYTLTNDGEVGTAFEVTGLPSWLDASVDSGVLDPGSRSVTLSVNSSANTLRTGVYQATVTFRDCTTGGLSYSRAVELRVDVDASATFRNAGTNPASYTTTLPILGSTVVADVNLGGTTGHLFAGLVGYATPLTFTLPGGQTLLVNIADPGGELLSAPLQPGPLATFLLPVPNDVSMAGKTLSIQAVHILGVMPYALGNAYDVKLGF